MTREQAINYLKSSGMSDEQIETVINALTCEDCISREEAEAIFKNARKSLYELSRKERVKDFQTREMMLLNAEQFIHLLPSVTPKFTDAEIQTMQELEQAQFEKAYELGKAEIQPCDDCISRQALLEKAIIVPIAKVVTEDKVICRKIVFVEDIQNLPSVTLQPKMGKWIQTKDDCDGVNFYDFSFECSKCGKEQSFKSNYCPNCGVEMRESEDK